MNVYLAGAPFSGKSSVLQLLQRARISRSVFCVEECFSSVVGRLPEPYRQRICADDEETSIFRQLIISGTQAYINAVGMGIKLAVTTEYLVQARNTLGKAVYSSAYFNEYAEIYAYALIMILLATLVSAVPETIKRIIRKG